MQAKILERFMGQPCTPPESSNQKNGLAFFTAPAPFHTTRLFSKDAYPNTPNFRAFMSYHFIKTLHHSSFDFLCKRRINNQWFQFKQLPLVISSVQYDGQSKKNILYNPNELSWPEFCDAFESAPSVLTPEEQTICHQIITTPMHFSGSIPSPSLHAPQLVLSPKDNQYTVSLTVPRSNCMPVALNKIIDNMQQDMQDTLQPQRAYAL